MSEPLPEQPDSIHVLHVLSAATFLVFFQAFMVAPLIPRLAQLFHASPNLVGIAIPAYLVPYGAMTLLWGPLSDQVGRGRVILASLAAFCVLTAATAVVNGAPTFLVARLVTALGASGVVPISLAFVGDRFEYHKRGHALGWLFGAMAGGIAFGSSAGALLEPLIGWRGLFLTVAAGGAGTLGYLARYRHTLGWHPSSGARPRLTVVAAGYLQLLRVGRARRTYTYVLMNAMLHSGIYTWLGLYFTTRHHLSEVAIGLALLGYGVPGFIFGPLIGHLADRKGRARLIPLGLALGACSAFALAPAVPTIAAAAALTALSLGYDLTQPLLGGIVTQLPASRGQAMGLNVFTLFVGFGVGSLVFQALLQAGGFATALTAFGVGAAIAAAVAVPLFKTETPQSTN